jgi:hypothetical protein
VNCERVVPDDDDGPAQTVDGQAADQIVGGIRFAIEQHVFAVIPDDEIEQALPLRREQRRPDGKRAVEVGRDQPLQEGAGAITGQPDDRSVGKGGRCHGP